MVQLIFRRDFASEKAVPEGPWLQGGVIEPHCKYYLRAPKKYKYSVQSHSQSPEVPWSVGGCHERIWGTGILTAEILWLTVLSFVTMNSQ